MLASVDFHDALPLEADEIDHGIVVRALRAEFVAIESAETQMTPEFVFRIGRLLAQLTLDLA